MIIPTERKGSYVFTEGKGHDSQRIMHAYDVDELATVTIKRVCEDCNTGWMHRIEDAAIPVLSRMIRGNPATLRDDTLQVAATWAFLKCLVADLTLHKPTRVPPQVHSWFREHKWPPQSVVILMGCYGGQRHPLYAGSRTVNFEIQIGEGERTKRHAYLSTIGVGHLVFQVFGHHFEWPVNLRPAGWKQDVSCLVWPEPDRAVRWPPRVHLDDSTLIRFAADL